MTWRATTLASTVIALGLAASSCRTDGSSPAAAVTSLAGAGEAARLLEGDEPLRARLWAAVKARGPCYHPRTHHLRPDGSPKFVNRLILEASPYLQQHAHNPVQWFPWGDEAFSVAAKLGRPVLLSIGYATCHWCHVMEEESFEDEQIARKLNAQYVCIKVDREERPDVDAIYMRALALLGKSGGWPLNMWLTPARQPFFGGTYFPPHDGGRGARKGLLTVLEEQRVAFDADPAGVAARAAALSNRVASSLAPNPDTGPLGADVIRRAVTSAARRYDPEHGGTLGRSKFPSSFPVRVALRYGRRSGEAPPVEMAIHTLKEMAAGGIYDQIGGGFHRYATDRRWLLPHFEKMLYDNAQLAVSYLEGAQSSGEQVLAEVARDTLEYVVREMTAPGGGYYSASDADSPDGHGHRREGLYFTWTPAEIAAVLPPADAVLASRYFGVTPSGTIEGRSVLHRPLPLRKLAAELSTTEAELGPRLRAARMSLLAARQRRLPPLIDDKVLAGDNGLMISAMARGARQLGAPRFAQSARRAARFILDSMVVDGRLRHSFRAGRTGTLAFADDLALVAAGLVDLFLTTGEPGWLEQAMVLMDALEHHHRRDQAGSYYRTADDHERLLAREIELGDGVRPAAGSVALMTQLRLWLLTTDERWRRRAESTLKAYAKAVGARPAAFSAMLLAVDWYTGAAKEIALVLPAASPATLAQPTALEQVLRRGFVPNAVLVVTREGGPAARLTKLLPWLEGKHARHGKPTAYVCELGHCELPTNDPSTLEKQLGSPPPYR